MVYALLADKYHTAVNSECGIANWDMPEWPIVPLALSLFATVDVKRSI